MEPNDISILMLIVCESLSTLCDFLRHEWSDMGGSSNGDVPAEYVAMNVHRRSAGGGTNCREFIRGGADDAGTIGGGMAELIDNSDRRQLALAAG